MPSRHVFLSYSRHDSEYAFRLYNQLTSEGLSAWIDQRSIRPGTSYSEEIYVAIENAYAVVLLYSAKANQSREIHKEIQLASGFGVPIIPLRLEDVPYHPVLGYHLSATQWINGGGDFELALATLLKQLGQVAPESVGSVAHSTTTAVDGAAATPRLESRGVSVPAAPHVGRNLRLPLISAFALALVVAGYFAVTGVSSGNSSNNATGTAVPVERDSTSLPKKLGPRVAAVKTSTTRSGKLKTDSGKASAMGTTPLTQDDQQPAAPIPAPNTSAPPDDTPMRAALDSLSAAVRRRGVDAAAARQLAAALSQLAPRISDPSLRARAWFRLIDASVLAGDLNGACSAFRGAAASALGAQRDELRTYDEQLGCS